MEVIHAMDNEDLLQNIAVGNQVRIIDKKTGELIHEFLPKSRSDESPAAPNPALQDPE